MQRLYKSETWSLRVKFDFMITHKCHLQKTPGNYQKKNCCNKVKHHYKFTSFPMIDYSPIWQSIIQFFTFHSIHKPKTVETDLFSKASKFLNASPKIIRKPFLTRESQHCHILAYPLRHLCYKQNHSWSIWTAKLSTILCL